MDCYKSALYKVIFNGSREDIWTRNFMPEVVIQFINVESMFVQAMSILKLK